MADTPDLPPMAAADRMPAQKFRLRGEAMTRLETFTDAAFAFAVTMLVISIDDIPRSPAELLAAFRGAPAFAVSFVQMMMFWLAHRRWSRRFGLEDNTSTILSFLLVILVMIYIYPLKIMFSSFLAWLSGGWLPSNFALASLDDVAQLFLIYGVGFSLLCGVIVLLNRHALKCAEKLQLNDLERFETRAEIGAWCILGAVGILSTLIAAFLPSPWNAQAGWAYFSLAFLMPAHHMLTDRRRQSDLNQS